MAYSGTKLQQRRRARKFGFMKRNKYATSVLKSKRLKMRTRLAVVVGSQKQRIIKK